MNESSKVRIVNLHFTNFPIGWSAKSLWAIFKKYDDICDVYIPDKMNSRGQRFGFACFRCLGDVLDLVDSLSSIWIGSFLLRFFLARMSIVYPWNFKNKIHNNNQVNPHIAKALVK